MLSFKHCQARAGEFLRNNGYFVITLSSRFRGELQNVTKVRWPTTLTSKPNAHSKFKSFTANSNRSQQIQIAHSKLQIAHSKFKSPTANSNRSQQIQESAFLSRVEGTFSSVEGPYFTLKNGLDYRIPIQLTLNFKMSPPQSHSQAIIYSQYVILIQCSYILSRNRSI